MQLAVDSSFLKLLYDWQTLIAGFFALMGALWTVKKIRDQIKQTQILSEEARKREEFAARAVLPLALSELTGYALKCLRLLRLISSGPLVQGMEVPQLQSDVIKVLQQCARYAEEGIAGKIWILLSKLQVQQSRLNGLLVSNVGNPISENEYVQNSLDAADLYAKTAELYTYARDESGMRGRASSEKLRSAFFAIGMYDYNEHPAIEFLEQEEALDGLADENE